MAESNDQDLSTINMSLWQTYIKGLVGAVEGVSPDNVLTTGSDVVSVLDAPLPQALAQVYRYGNTIPAWKANWQDTDAQLLSTYSSWLEAIRPTNATPTAAQLAQLQALQTKIDQAKDDFGTAFKQAYVDWTTNYTLNGTPIPGSPTWDEYRSSGSIADKLSTAAHELDGPTTEYDTLAEQIYGDGYKQLQEARQVAAAADPDSAESQTKSNPDLEARYQMTIAGNGGGKVAAPAFQIGADTVSAYKTWLKTARANKARSPTINFSSSNYSYDKSSWQFMVNIPIPLDDFFWAGVSAGASHSSVDIRKTSWAAQMSFQGGVFYAPLKAPWFREDLVRLYANFNGWSDQSPYAPPTQLWGPKGIFNVYVTGLLIGFAPYIKVDVDDWSQSDVKTAWSTNVSFGIGPFTLGSLGGASGGSEHFKQNQTATGFEAYDISGQPKIVGVTVDTPNFSGGAGQ